MITISFILRIWCSDSVVLAWYTKDGKLWDTFLLSYN